ncbi:MAG: group II intron reverse transcriptase domain-containing protein [Candidatus Marinimicrobia bacterium]|nr:group II intron reverse transcriptase domain-containing protein [Candidatus Neomarinimicrobiota bacterium]
MQSTLFHENQNDKALTDLFQAYFDARKYKRNTINALAFEKHLEENIFSLHDEIVARQYEPQKSICFIVDKPVKREIFAAHFRDRVIHHLIYNYISPIFDKTFINDSFSCRVGKGTHYGINRVDHFIRSCSENYSKPCYILKLDIKGYFMAMNKKILLKKLNHTLIEKKLSIDFDIELVNYLIDKTVNANPVNNCTIKGKQSDWNGLPPDKSLFTAKEDCGFPIGNLTSQLFGNIYMNEFDHYVKRELKIRYYGRYVDDFILIHNDKDYLKSIIPTIKAYLRENLELTLHPDKVYLQHFSKGVNYLGTNIKPHRIYISQRTKGNFTKSMISKNLIVENQHPNNDELSHFISSMNSYLGIMKHYKTYHLRSFLLLTYISAWWWNYVYDCKGYSKLVLKRKVI